MMEKNNSKVAIGVVGVGMVGNEVARHFLDLGWSRGTNLFLYDKDPRKKYDDDIKKADVVFVCVPTPSKKDGSCDPSIVESVIKEYHHPEKTFVIKSTIEPGTAARLQKKYASPILFNPEFLTESRAREDFIRPDRQIMGHTQASVAQAGSLINMLPQAFFNAPGTLGTYRFTRINSSEAEMGKYAGNVFGAMKVAYSNILADFARALEDIHKKEGIDLPVDYENVRAMVAHDRRIGDAWMDVNHSAYRGFGGYCFPKDIDAFISFGEKLVKKLKAKKDAPHRALVAHGVMFLKAIRRYNDVLLESQGLNSQIVRSHDAELKQFLKKKVKKI